MKRNFQAQFIGAKKGRFGSVEAINLIDLCRSASPLAWQLLREFGIHPKLLSPSERRLLHSAVNITSKNEVPGRPKGLMPLELLQRIARYFNVEDVVSDAVSGRMSLLAYANALEAALC